MDLLDLPFPQKSDSYSIYLPRYIMPFPWIKSGSKTEENVCNKHTFLLLSYSAFKTKLARNVFGSHKLYHI